MLKSQEISAIFNEQKQFFNKKTTLSYEYRYEQLTKLKNAVLKYETALTSALQKDLGKSKLESYTTEIGFVLHSISNAQNNLKKWVKPKKVKTPWYLFPAKSYINHGPYGNVLIMGPYNYPVQLLIEPLIGAISAGNCTILSPSNLTANTTQVLKKLINETFSPAYIYCTDGELEENIALLNQPFDYIFFTGSKHVGKIVMQKAAENLTPITLELGGKSPVIVDKTADLEVCAQRIIWGKLMNAGQTCVAPDYLFVDKSIQQDLITELTLAIQKFYGNDIENNPDYGRIINLNHFNRLNRILKQDEAYIVFGGKTNAEKLFIEPTLLSLKNAMASSMQEEIFGPILPILTYENIDEALEYINAHDKPLALYIFSQDKRQMNYILNQTTSGGVSINDTINHLTNLNLPFGGIGASGMGNYHGKYSFETFSHKRSIINKTTKINLKLLFPPYTDLKYKLIHRFFK